MKTRIQILQTIQGVLRTAAILEMKPDNPALVDALTEFAFELAGLSEAPRGALSEPGSIEPVNLQVRNFQQ